MCRPDGTVILSLECRQLYIYANRKWYLWCPLLVVVYCGNCLCSCCSINTQYKNFSSVHCLCGICVRMQHAWNYISTHWADWTWMDRRTKISRISSWKIWQPYCTHLHVVFSGQRTPFKSLVLQVSYARVLALSSCYLHLHRTFDRFYVFKDFAFSLVRCLHLVQCAFGAKCYWPHVGSGAL